MPPTIRNRSSLRTHTAAMSLVVTMNAGPASEAAVRALCGDLAGLLRAGVPGPRGPVVLHQRRSAPTPGASSSEIRGRKNCIRSEIRGQHHAVATPGDILFHIRACAWICASSWRPRSCRSSGARLHGGRSAWLPVLSDRDLLRVRRWHGRIRGPGRRRRRPHRRRGRGIRRWELRDRASTST